MLPSFLISNRSSFSEALFIMRDTNGVISYFLWNFLGFFSENWRSRLRKFCTITFCTTLLEIRNQFEISLPFYVVFSRTQNHLYTFLASFMTLLKHKEILWTLLKGHSAKMHTKFTRSIHTTDDDNVTQQQFTHFRMFLITKHMQKCMTKLNSHEET